MVGGRPKGRFHAQQRPKNLEEALGRTLLFQLFPFVYIGLLRSLVESKAYEQWLRRAAEVGGTRCGCVIVDHSIGQQEAKSTHLL